MKSQSWSDRWKNYRATENPDGVTHRVEISRDSEVPYYVCENASLSLVRYWQADAAIHEVVAIAESKLQSEEERLFCRVEAEKRQSELDRRLLSSAAEIADTVLDATIGDDLIEDSDKYTVACLILAKAIEIVGSASRIADSFKRETIDTPTTIEQAA